MIFGDYKPILFGLIAVSSGLEQSQIFGLTLNKFIDAYQNDIDKFDVGGRIQERTE